MEDIKACPIAYNKLIKKAMHSNKDAMNECFDLDITSKRHIIIESNECKNETAEYMCCRVDGYFFKEDTFLSHRGTNAAIQDIQFKGANSATDGFDERFLVSK